MGRDWSAVCLCVCRELENCRDGEINEMIDIYVDRGMSREDAEVRGRSSDEKGEGG